MNKFQEFEELKKRGVKLNKDGDVVHWNPNYFPKYIKENESIIFAQDKSYYSYENGMWKCKMKVNC